MATKKNVKKAARKPARKPVGRPARRAVAKTRSAKPARAARKPKPKARAGRKTVATKTVGRAKTMARKVPARKAAPVAKARPVAKVKAPDRRTPVLPPPTLQRERRRLPEAEAEAEAEMFTDATKDSRLMSSARAGHDDLRSEIRQHTESSPAMTAGDVDAKWQDAYALGDEAPGGDNMTPDQDRVDDIGKALGIEYADDEELLGGDELLERDEHRWELDPASKDEDDDL